MNVLAIHGSPRNEGFSSSLHNIFTGNLKDRGFTVEELRVYEKKILPCKACGSCEEKFLCPLDDDMPAIYRQVINADIISVSSPLYFSSLPSQLKAFIDRCQVFWAEKNSGVPSIIHKKNGVFICTAGSAYDNMFSGVMLTMRHFYNTINASFTTEDALLVPGLDQEKKITLEIINGAANLSERIINGTGIHETDS